MTEVLTVISNAALLIPAVTAVYWRRIYRAFVFFVETFASALYHLSDYSGYGFFPFHTLHYLDFFFAESIMLLAALYIVHFNRRWAWLEWVLIFLGELAIVVLQIAMTSELIVQAVMAVFLFGGVIIYWLVFYCMYGALPPYRWHFLFLGLGLLSMSSILYSAQLVWPDGYWATHSIWHITAGLGNHYILLIKKPAVKYENAAAKIK